MTPSIDTTFQRFSGLFDELESLDAIQFSSDISASQYLLAYRLILEHAKPGASVLDWGSGEGHFSLFLLEQGFKTTGFTIQSTCKLAKHLSTRFKDQYRLVSDPDAISELCFKDNEFDVVTSIGVLEHVREPGGSEVASLQEIRRILKPGGVFICYHFPNKYSWIEAISQHIEGKYSHTYKYTRKDIRQLLQQSNLELIETNRYGLLPRLVFRKLPDQAFVTQCFNAADSTLSRLLSSICQNHYFVARKSL
ncbi:MAG: class I SAM-dependent methyltransferase [Cyanobacteria bacterium J06573_11]